MLKQDSTPRRETPSWPQPIMTQTKWMWTELASNVSQPKKESATLKKDGASNVDKRDIEPMNARREPRTMCRTNTQDETDSLIETDNLPGVCHLAETSTKPRQKRPRRKRIPLNPLLNQKQQNHRQTLSRKEPPQLKRY